MKTMRVVFFILLTILSDYVFPQLLLPDFKFKDLVTRRKLWSGLNVHPDLGYNEVLENKLRLTEDLPGHEGAIWSKHTLDYPEWIILVDFQITSMEDSFGDGLAVWVTTERLELGEVFGGSSDFIGLGVFVDTYSNENGQSHKQPVVSGMLGNGTFDYSLNHHEDISRVAACHRILMNKRTTLRIVYQNHTITASLRCSSSNCYSKSYYDCFVMYNVTLPRPSYVGVSAATGDLSQAHDLFDIRVYSLSTDGSLKPKITKTENKIQTEKQLENLPTDALKVKENLGKTDERVNTVKSQPENLPTEGLKAKVKENLDKVDEHVNAVKSQGMSMMENGFDKIDKNVNKVKSESQTIMENGLVWITLLLQIFFSFLIVCVIILISFICLDMWLKRQATLRKDA